MNRILVSGGAGFLGSHLCDYLITCGDEVICMDNLYTGSKENIRHLLKNDRFEFIRHDITEKLPNIEANQIYNLACPASPVQYKKHPVETIKSSVLGAINVLELAKRNEARILQASTSEIYGDPLKHPQDESYFGNVNTLSDRSCYDEGKRVAETLFYTYLREYGTDIKIARIFNSYGPRMAVDDGRVVSNFIVNALQGEPLTICDGHQTRSFCYVDDTIRGLYLLMNSNYNMPVNIGNTNEITIKELADLITELTHSESKYKTVNLESGDPTRRRPDIFKAKLVLDWEPYTSLSLGLSKTIRYFEDKLKETK